MVARVCSDAMEACPSLVGFAPLAVYATGYLGVFILQHIRCLCLRVHHRVQDIPGDIDSNLYPSLLKECDEYIPTYLGLNSPQQEKPKCLVLNSCHANTE